MATCFFLAALFLTGVAVHLDVTFGDGQRARVTINVVLDLLPPPTCTTEPLRGKEGLHVDVARSPGVARVHPKGRGDGLRALIRVTRVALDPG